MLELKKLRKKSPNHVVYITTSEFNEFSSTIFGQRLKQAKLVRNKDPYTASKLANKNEQKLKTYKRLI